MSQCGCPDSTIGRSCLVALPCPQESRLIGCLIVCSPKWRLAKRRRRYIHGILPEGREVPRNPLGLTIGGHTTSPIIIINIITVPSDRSAIIRCTRLSTKVFRVQTMRVPRSLRVGALLLRVGAVQRPMGMAVKICRRVKRATRRETSAITLTRTPVAFEVARGCPALISLWSNRGGKRQLTLYQPHNKSRNRGYVIQLSDLLININSHHDHDHDGCFS